MNCTPLSKMMLIVMISILSSVISFAQKANVWNSLPSVELQKITPLAGFHWDKVNVVAIPRTTLQNKLRFAPKQTADLRSNNSNFIIELPLPTGESVNFRLVESALLTPESAEAFPFIKTYEGVAVDNPLHRVHITLSHLGINALLEDGQSKVYIRPYNRLGSDEHIVFDAQEEIVPQGVSCGVNSERISNEIQSSERGQRAVSDCQLRTYRVAVAATGEYTVWAGSQANAAANITATMNNVKAIYERETTITFTLVLNNAILFTDAATDPYTAIGTSGTTLAANHTAIVNAIGVGAFDLGHLFSQDWNGGLANTSVICSASNKGGAQSGLKTSTFPAGPTGLVMENTVAHEIAHQFSVSHTMSSNAGGCSGNVSLPTAVETVGGSTIMAYAGVCTGSYQSQSDQYFHTTSITQLTTYAISQNTCGVTSALSNTAPAIAMAGTNYSIPSGTPFLLSATGSDVNGDALTYTFEQTDAITVATASNPTSTVTNGPCFRSYPPNSTSFRYFPPLANVVAGTTPAVEVLPTVARTLTFRPVVRDNRSGGGCSAEIALTINTIGTTPFRVSSQNSATSLTANGANTFTIVWDVAGSDVAPVNCANVKISFSTDGGATFPTVLFSSTANDGTETFIVPNLPTTVGRIKIEAVDNIFFDINDANITITSASGCAAEAATLAPTAAVVANVGAGALNLGLSPQYGTAISNFSGSITTADPSFTSVGSSASACSNINSGAHYDAYTFMAGTSGSYTFTNSSGSAAVITNLYNGAFNAASQCSNWVASSAVNSGGWTVNNSMAYTLVTGITYTLVISDFGNSFPALPSSYVKTPSGGTLYNGIANPGASYNYAYVVVNTATNNVKAIQANSDLTNSGTFPAGQYAVYGLSYQNTTTLASLQGTYVNNAFSTLQNAVLNATFCGDFSGNSVAVTINCAVAPTVTISNNNGLNIGCNPASTTLTASGGVSYVWSTNATSAAITVSTGGTYQVTATDAGGCKGVNSVNVNYSTAVPVLSISNDNGLALGCAVPSTNLTATGGGTYAWSGGGSSATKAVSAAGTYTVTVTNSSGCTTTSSVSTYISNAVGATISPTTAVSGTLNNPSLDLALTPQYVATMTTPIGGTLTTSDPASSGAFVNVTAPSCFSANSVRYKVYSFQVNVGGTYTFNTGVNSLVISLYNGSYSSASPCTNLINSGSIFNGSSVSIGSSVAATLNPGTTYVLLLSSFSPTTPTLPFTFSVNVTTPLGGAIYPSAGVINPGAAFNYTYVMVKGTTIAAINNSSDLSGINVAGTYTVYGLSYHSSIFNATLNAYIGTAFSSLQNNITNNTFCGSLSTNTVTVTINCAAPEVVTISPNTPLACSTGNITLMSNSGASYQWSANASSATSQNVVVGPGTYSVTLTAASGCTGTGTTTVGLKPYALATANGTTALTEECTVSGWTNYSVSDKMMFAIEWQPTGSVYNNTPAKNAATVTLGYDAANGSSTAASEGTFSMKRYWNVNLGAQSLAGPVNVRFFYDGAEKTATATQASTFAGTVGQPTETPTWFKTVGGAFNPATSLTSGGITTAIPLTDVNAGAATTINGVLYAQFDGIASFSGGGFAAGVGVGLTLPIQLLSFTGKKVDNTVALQWATESERNVKDFTLQKSTDGIQYVNLTTIASAKNANTTKRYAYTDLAPSTGDNYYRLIVSDLDGSVRQEGNVVTVRFDKKGEVAIYPNPTSGKLSIRFQSEQNSNANLRIYNVLGSTVKEFATTIDKGDNLLDLDLSDLPNGTYCLDMGQAQKYIFIKE
jgi:DNA-binding protein YbaB